MFCLESAGLLAGVTALWKYRWEGGAGTGADDVFLGISAACAVSALLLCIRGATVTQGPPTGHGVT